MAADSIEAKLARAHALIGTIPAARWGHIEKGRIYLADGGMIASVREQIPDDVDPDGDDPEAWKIGDAAVEEAGQRAEAVALLVNARVAIFDAIGKAIALRAHVGLAEDEDGDPVAFLDSGFEESLSHLDAALARLSEVLP